MAVSDLLMQIRIAVTGDNGAVIRRLESQLRQLQATANQLQNINLAGLNADLAGLRSSLGAAKILNLGTLPADLARFKSELLTATTAGANFRSVIKGLNNDSQKIRQLDIAPLRQQIQDINRALQTTKLTKLTPLQNSFRAASNDVLATQIKIRDLRETIRTLPPTNPLRVTADNDLKKAINELGRYQNAVDQSRIAINSETSSLANSALARRQQVNALQSQISGHNQLILANQRSISQERANLLAEERKAIAARNNVGLTQAQIKAEQEASRIRQDAIRTAISTKEQEIIAAKRGIAANQEQINSVKALLAQQKLLNRSGQSFSALKEFSSSIGFLFGPQMAGLAFVASVASMVSSFATANKEVETLIRGLNAISSGNGRAEFEYLTAVSNKLGISIQESAHSFLNLEATTAGTAIEGTKTKQIFESFARALNVTGADAVTFNRAFRAVSQTLSKGQLYAEELKGQLAEALPGAIQAFAKAIDVTPKKFLEMVKAGQFAGQTLYDLYELVAKQLDKTYKVGSEQDFTFIQKANLAKNAFVELSVAIGDTGIWKSASNVMLSFRDTLQSIQGDIPYLEENIRSLGRELKDLFPKDINFGGIGEALSKVGSFSLQSWFDIAANIRTVVEVIVNELANLENEVMSVTIGMVTPIRENFERAGVYITTFFQNASNNVMQVITGMSLGFRETFYVPVVSIVNDLISRIADINYSLSEALSFSGFSESAQYFLGLSNSLRSSGISMDEVNAKTESLRKEFTLLQNANKSGYSGLLQQGLDALAKQHKAVREEIEREYQANKAAAQAGIDAALALNDSKKKQRDAQIELNRLLREQNEISRRERGSRNDILKVNPVGDEELTIAKSRFDYEKRILKIKQDQREAEAGFSKNLYQSWVKSGSMSQGSADFLSGLAEQRAALDTIKDAYAAIDAYNEQNINGSSELVKLHREMALEQIVSAKEMAKKTNNEYKYKELVKEELRLRKEGLDGSKGSTNEAAELIRKAKLKPIEEQEIIDVNTKAQEVLDSLKPLTIKSEISTPEIQVDKKSDLLSSLQQEYKNTQQVFNEKLQVNIDDTQLKGSNVFSDIALSILDFLVPAANAAEDGVSNIGNGLVVATTNAKDFKKEVSDFGNVNISNTITKEINQFVSSIGRAGQEIKESSFSKSIDSLMSDTFLLFDQFSSLINKSFSSIDFSSYINTELNQLDKSFSSAFDLIKNSELVNFLSLKNTGDLGIFYKEFSKIFSNFNIGDTTELKTLFSLIDEIKSISSDIASSTEFTTFFSLFNKLSNQSSLVVDEFGKSVDSTYSDIITSFKQLLYVYNQLANRKEVLGNIDIQPLQELIAVAKNIQNIDIGKLIQHNSTEPFDYLVEFKAKPDSLISLENVFKNKVKPVVLPITTNTDQVRREGETVGQTIKDSAQNIVDQSSSLKIKADIDLSKTKKTSEQVKKDVLGILDKDGKKVNFIVSATGVTAANEDMKRLAAQKEIKVSAYTDQPSLEATKKKFDEAGGYIKDGLRGATTIAPQKIQETLDKTFGKGAYQLEITPTLIGGVTEDGWIQNNEIKRNLIITPVAGDNTAIAGMVQQQSENIKAGYEGAWQKLRELDTQGQQTVQETPIQKKVALDTVDAYAQDSDLVSNLSREVTKYVNVVYRESGSSAPARAATGGYFPGYGGGDRIHALLEAGEFVLRKEAVRKLGLSNVFDLNNLDIPKPSRSVDRVSIPSFSSGGYVGSSSVINIHIPNGKNIQVTGSRESATALANLLTRVSRSV